jgi:hypothetical protein
LTLIKKELTDFLKDHEVKVKGGKGYNIVFNVVKSIPGIGTKLKSPKMMDESYQIQVGEKGAVISATGTKGFFYGMKTLEQLILRRGGKTTIASCKIVDWPDFEIRGFTNDVGRNYMPVDAIKRVIDSMAQVKMNVYHFHFTENEGWRLETKLYPELNDPQNFTRRPGDFYTQEEFKDLVEYCRLRNVTLIPEMDMPGHSGCFRRSLNINSMNDPKAIEALGKLVREMYDLVPKGHLPYIHIGTDEAREPETKVNNDTLVSYFNFVDKLPAPTPKPIRWQPGLSPSGYNNAVEHLWSGRAAAKAWPTKGSQYIDSLETYINHIDPFEMSMVAYFRRPCPFSDAEGLGMILCSWPDLPIEDPVTQETITGIYSGIALISEPLWNNPHAPYKFDPNKDEYFKYFSNLPVQGDPLLKGFAEYENRVVAIRDRFFKNRPFPYVRQADIGWKLLGPIPNNGKTDTVFAPEEQLKSSGKLVKKYTIDNKDYEWSKEAYTGATLIFKHYCDYPTIFNGGEVGKFPGKNTTYYATTSIYSPKDQEVPFWVSGQTWAVSDWRNGPVSVQGKWFHCDTKFWVNGKEIEPPEWAKPGNNGALIDENYYLRQPTMIQLKKGWNQVLVKAPVNGSARRWMFTFVPVQWSEKKGTQYVREFPGLKFSPELAPKG